MKPFAESCVQNQAEIFSILNVLLKNKKHVLEIGSGTGQHAVYFAERLPHLVWQTSDQSQYHEGINLWLDEAKLENTKAPITLNVNQTDWPQADFDAIFSANAIHIMSWEDVINYFTNGAKSIGSKGLFILYGPFNYNGKFTSESNARFDDWLKSRDLNSGVRDFEALDELANNNKMTLKHDFEMAANNRILCWEKA